MQGVVADRARDQLVGLHVSAGRILDLLLLAMTPAARGAPVARAMAVKAAVLPARAGNATFAVAVVKRRCSSLACLSQHLLLNGGDLGKDGQVVVDAVVVLLVLGEVLEASAVAVVSAEDDAVHTARADAAALFPGVALLALLLFHLRDQRCAGVTWVG